ncbi:sugar phosphate isomerase/epimerase family protein [Pseudalkalibacillus salsuginis]|uniref:sugar phosphate isomerase/epimerase family protein n=1 Tax=Pseudalkalibacillus salsuginis TaxID=2910972 RepID=UPI001F33C1AC|nr:TIM barrel protein [Pseudalkalibacillus salsuginis]MCF6410741.1 sugar phosphate isomerase/epimerase [Pseudalkalibacillus salsuginis]
MQIKFGCHGSTWELDYDKECDYLDRIMNTVKIAGFKGIDVQVALLGRYKNQPERLKEELAKRKIELAALTVPFTWEGENESAEEKEHADYYINFLKHFSGAVMNVPSRVGPNRDHLLKRQKEIINCVNSLGKRAFENGVVASFHPASPKTSYFRIKEDYDVLFEEIDRRYVGYTPDAGHIMAGGMNPVEIIRDNLSIIKHVHFKDCSVTFKWRKMGTGDIDFPTIVETLQNYNYKGWIMVEEETDEAAQEPDKVIHDVGEYVQSHLVPITTGVRNSAK